MIDAFWIFFLICGAAGFVLLPSVGFALLLWHFGLHWVFALVIGGAMFILCLVALYALGESTCPQWF